MNKSATIRTLLAAGLTVASASALAQAGGAPAPDTYSSIPRSWQETLQLMNGEGNASDTARQVRDQAMGQRDARYAGLDPRLDATANASLQDHATKSGINAAVIDAGVDRESRLKEIEAQLDGNESEVAIGALNARTQLENGRMLNELLKLQAANTLIDSQKQVRDDEEYRTRNLQLNHDLSTANP